MVLLPHGFGYSLSLELTYDFPPSGANKSFKSVAILSLIMSDEIFCDLKGDTLM